jgi:lysyl endopeptidase
MKKLIPAVFFFVFSLQAYAQLSFGGKPKSFGMAEMPEPQNITMEPFDTEAMLREDEITNKIGPYRFGKNFETALFPSNSGSWHELNNGDRIWRLAISSPGAYSINLTFSDFFIPEGANLFIYNEDKSMVLGAFTHKNNHPERLFASDLVKGDKIYLEYYEPAAIRNQGSIVISLITHAYLDLFNFGKKSLGSSGLCNINVNCPEGYPYSDQIRSVVMLVSGGNGFCSGAVINNTAQDGKPYILTANHCGSSGYGSWVFRFNWEAPSCTNPTSSPTFQSLTGAQLRARKNSSDFQLLELNNAIPANYRPYFAGWNNSTTPATRGAGIHHPAGDIKKIALFTQSVTTSSWAGVASWRVVRWNRGTTEGGSSGSPLFNQNGHIVGQLFGGDASCFEDGSDYYGRLSSSWTGTSATERLSDWLDPLNSAVTILEGYDPNFTPLINEARIIVFEDPEPGSSFCKESVIPKIVIKNFGTAPLTSLTINYNLSAGASGSLNWTGNLSTGEFQTVTLPELSLTPGGKTLTVTLEHPNNDLTAPTSTRTSSFTVESPINVISIIPFFKEDFEATTFPPSGWTRNNPDGATTWSRTTSASGFSQGTASAFMNNFNYNTYGQRDLLITPYLNFSAAVAPAKLEFDVAYARRSSLYSDSLIVSVSADCGGTWERVYFKGGFSLSTIGNSNLSTVFVPDTNQWRTEIINLDNYIGNPNVRIRFESISFNGNNLYLDNLKVGDIQMAISEKSNTSMKLYPNPAHDKLHFESSEPAENVVIKDIYGKTLLTEILTHRDTKHFVSVSELPAGIYIIELNTTSKSIKSKFVKSN